MRRRDWMVGALAPLSQQGLQWQERAPMPVPRAGLIAGVFRNRLVVAGGSDWQDEKKVLYNRTDLFDPAANQWQSGPELPEPRCDAATASTSEGVFAFGGIVAGQMTSSALRFDGRRWREWPEAALPEPTTYSVAATVNRSIYLFGGLQKTGDLSSASSWLRCWSGGPSWKELARFPGRPRVSSAISILHGQLLVLGGVYQPAGGKLENLSEVWSYDLSRDQWKQRPDLPLVRRAWSAVPAGREILLLGGYTEDFESSVYGYDPASGKLREAGKLPHPLADVRFVRIGSRCLNAGGETGFHIRAPWTIEALLS